LHPTPPSVSVLIVSDYAAGGPDGWKHVPRALATLRDHLPGPVEFIVCESERFRAAVPPELTALVPSLRLLLAPETASYALKNRGVEAASADLVAILDADCLPDAAWLRRLVEHLRAHPEAAAVSGRTVYAETSLAVRICALLGRAYTDPGEAGETRFVAVNNCAFRRTAYLACPLPTGLGTFSSRIQSEALRRAGWTLRFDPAITVVHDFEGWAMEADFRRNCGHGTIRTRLEDPTLPYAWLARLGPIAIAPILAGKVLDSWRDCLRCGRTYGLRWYEVPAALLASIGLHLLEIPGMWRAYSGGGLGASQFR